MQRKFLQIENEVEDDKFNKFVKKLIKAYPTITNRKNKITLEKRSHVYTYDEYSYDQKTFIEAVSYFITGKWGIAKQFLYWGGYNYDTISKGNYNMPFEKLPNVRVYQNTKIDFIFADEQTAKEFIDTMTNFK